MFLFIHLFIHSFSCALTQPTLHSTSFLAIYSRSFKRPKKKLWTCSKETRPKHPEEPFCLTFIHSCYFSSVPPESIWQTQWKKKKKTLREEKQQVVLEPPTPHLLWYYLLLLSTDNVRWYDFYSLVLWSLWLLFELLFCLWKAVIWDSNGRRVFPRVHLIVHSVPS